MIAELEPARRPVQPSDSVSRSCDRLAVAVGGGGQRGGQLRPAGRVAQAQQQGQQHAAAVGGARARAGSRGVVQRADRLLRSGPRVVAQRAAAVEVGAAGGEGVQGLLGGDGDGRRPGVQLVQRVGRRVEHRRADPARIPVGVHRGRGWRRSPAPIRVRVDWPSAARSASRSSAAAVLLTWDSSGPATSPHSKVSDRDSSASAAADAGSVGSMPRVISAAVSWPDRQSIGPDCPVPTRSTVITAKWSRTAGDRPAATAATRSAAVLAGRAAQHDHRGRVLGDPGRPGPGDLDGLVAEGARGLRSTTHRCAVDLEGQPGGPVDGVDVTARLPN